MIMDFTNYDAEGFKIDLKQYIYGFSKCYALVLFQNSISDKQFKLFKAVKLVSLKISIISRSEKNIKMKKVKKFIVY